MESVGSNPIAATNKFRPGVVRFRKSVGGIGGKCGCLRYIRFDSEAQRFTTKHHNKERKETGMSKLKLFIAKVLVSFSPELVNELVTESLETGEDIDSVVYRTIWRR